MNKGLDLKSKAFKDFHTKIINALTKFYYDRKPFVVKIRNGRIYLVKLRMYYEEDGNEVMKPCLYFINEERKEVFLEVFDRNFYTLELNKFLQFAYIVAYVIFNNYKAKGVKCVKIEEFSSYGR